MSDSVERRIPDLAREAFADAHAATLRAGLPVVGRSGRHIVRVYPDGRREHIKTIGDKVKVEKGARYTLR